MKQILLILLLICTYISAQPQFGGYLENSTALMIDGGHEELFTDVANLRLEGSWDWENGGMEVHATVTKAFRPIIPFYEVYRDNSLMMNMTNQFLGIYMQSLTPELEALLGEGSLDSALTEEQMEQLAEMGKLLPYSSFYPSTLVNLDRALIKLYLPFMDIYVGRQPIAWGTGYAFNPTDLWNMKNPADAEAPKAGLNALRLEIPLGDLAGVSLVASPGQTFKYSSGGFRVKWNLAGFDMSVSGLSLMNADRKLFELPRKIVAGTDLAGQIGDVGIWYEAAVTNRLYSDYTNFDSLFTQVDLGADYTFPGGFYIMAEYLYNSLGQKSYKDYTFADMSAVMAGEAPGMGQHYLFGGVRQDIGGIVALGCYGLTSIQDRGGMILPEITYTFNDNIDVQLRGTIAAGNKVRSEFASMKSSALLKVTGYF